MSITVPPILEDTQRAFDIIKNVSSLDAKHIKEVECYIKNFHALNDTEKNKHEEAKKLISKYQELLDSSNKATIQLNLDKDNWAKEKKQFEDNKKSYLDDLAVKHHVLDEGKNVLLKQQDELEESKRQIKVAQDSLTAITNQNLEKEKIFLQKEVSLKLKEEELNNREEKIILSESKVKNKIAELNTKLKPIDD